MTELEIHQFPCLKDNFGVLIRDPSTGEVASIDAPEAAAIEAALAAKGWRLTHILSTHHHWDHTDGNLPLKQATGCKIIGTRHEAEPIPGIDVAVGDGEVFSFGTFDVHVHHCPGHTKGHVILHMPAAKVAFVGDVLFAMGCGRVNEGTMDEMWASLCKVAALPADTALYFGHEYTVSNAKFALSVEPGNAALIARAAEVEAARARGEWTSPTRVDLELATNPFLRPSSPEIRARLGLQAASDAAVFGELRERKNRG
ncbi:MAG: hydroxyacylglutathione hydrolase [Hyphomicrobiaceae bacterium]